VAVALLNGGRYSGRQGGADAICRERVRPGHPDAETRTSGPIKGLRIEDRGVAAAAISELAP
jgi:hypothetical protein